MINEEMHTDVDLKYFGERLNIEKDLTGKDRSHYTYQANYKGIPYILKGYKIQLSRSNTELNGEIFKKGVERISEVLQEYYLGRAVCLFSQHFVKPLALDYAVKMTSSKDSYMHIEIIYEYGGISLERLKPPNVELIHNLMQQSIDALLLLHNLGVAHLNVSPASMVYDTRRDILKLTGMGNVLDCSIQADSVRKLEERMKLEYAPPEILRGAEESSGHGVISNTADVYCWAMSFCSVLSNRKDTDFESDYDKYRRETDADYSIFMKKVENIFDSTKAKSSKEMSISSAIKEILNSALSYKARERPTIQEISSKLKKAGESDLQIVGKIKVFKKDSKVELNCGHEVSKEYLAEYVMISFLNRLPYKHSCLCTVCQKVEKLKSLPLDCGCTWAKFNENCKFIGGPEGIIEAKCEKNNSMTPIDICLLNDYMSSKFTFYMLSNYPGKKTWAMADVFDRFVSGETKKTIVWALKHTNLITHVDLSKDKEEHPQNAFTTYHFQDSRSSEESMAVYEAKHIIDVLKVSRFLVYLNLSNNNMKAEGVKAIAEALKINEALRCLELSNVRMQIAGAEAIGKALQVNKSLAKLCISNNDLMHPGTKGIFKGVKVNEGLVSLNISKNRIEYASIECISKALQNNKKLEALDMSNNNLGYKCKDGFINMFKVNKTLRELRLYSVGITEISNFDEALKASTKITCLDLSANELNVNDLDAFGAMLKANKDLTRLEFNLNMLKNEPVITMSKVFESSKMLLELSLDINQIKDIGAQSVGQMLKVNKSLTKLSLESNKLTAVAGKIIGSALKVNKTLKHLLLSYNELGDEGVTAIANGLKHNKSLINLALRGVISSYVADSKVMESAKSIGEMLELNTALTHLNFERNLISDEDAEHIIKGLRSNKALKELNIREGHFSVIGMRKILESLEYNNVLESLIVSSSTLTAYDYNKFFKPLLKKFKHRLPNEELFTSFTC
eukprot:TRINITY_DN3043_c0_g2_i2.p1 TRINITY_DN3043_c0_g2~~TRINITY_DN3043_c0_g2_i2.p1  ORF type:complete len:964 (+),score=142.60 TRINITY_DN3043_c0_g2_i2:122-3013(+)